MRALLICGFRPERPIGHDGISLQVMPARRRIAGLAGDSDMDLVAVFAAGFHNLLTINGAAIGLFDYREQLYRKHISQEIFHY